MIKTIVVVDRNGEEHSYTDEEGDKANKYTYYTHEYSDGGTSDEQADRLLIRRSTVKIAEYFKPRYIKIFWE